MARSPGALLIAWLTPWSAAAQTAPQEPIRVEERALGSCTISPPFFARMAARTARVRLPHADESSRVMLVQIGGRRDGVWGRLTIRDPDGHESHRDIRGRDCGEVIDGLALVAALAVDPTASTAVPAASSGALDSTGGAVLPAPSSGTNEAPGGAVSAPRKQQPDKAVIEPERPRTGELLVHPAEPAKNDRVTEDGGWSLGASLNGSAVSAIAPQPLWGGGISLDVRALGTTGWSPLLGLSFAHHEHATFSFGSAGARFTYTGGTLDLCPLALPIHRDVDVRACGRVALGQVTAEGSGSALVNPRISRRSWADVGGGARLDWSLSPRFELHLQGGCIFPLRRDVYDFGADALHDVPFVGGAAEAGIRVRLL